MHHLSDIDPYRMPSGSDLDGLLHRFLFKASDDVTPPAYSTDLREAEKVAARLKSNFEMKNLTTGRTRLSHKPFFARHESGPSTSTEVIAETLPLAICRLALLQVVKDAGREP
jgi:hypothetical protein